MARGTRQICALLATATLFCGRAAALNPHKLLTQYSYAAWNQEQGLPQDAIHAIAQTADGYLWLGTAEGLARFDGYEFVVFDKDHNKLPADAITALVGSRDGALWVGTPAGLAEYRDGHFRTFTTSDGLPDNAISKLYEDTAGTLWIAAGLYLSRFQSGKFTTYAPGSDIPVTSVRAVSTDHTGNVWVAGFGGVARQTGGRFGTVIEEAVLGSNTVNGMITDHMNNLWIAGSQGLLMRSANGTIRRFDARDGLPDSVVHTVWESRDGTIWAGTRGGIARFENGGFAGFNRTQNRGRDPVFAIFEDRERNIWVGTNGGLNRFRDDIFTVYGTLEGLPSDVPNAVFQDHTGRVWVGFHDNGLLLFSPLRSKVYTTRDGLPVNEVLSIHESHNGDLLLSTTGGLARLHGNNFATYHPPDRLSRRTVYDALEDSRGRLWLATPGGLGELRGGEFHVVVPGGPLLSSAVGVLCEARDGTIWAGTLGKGLWSVNGTTIRQYTISDGLSSNGIRSLYEDADGTLWIGTFAGGLDVFHQGRFQSFTVKDGLLSNNVYHVADGGDSLWMSTTRGICQIRKRQLSDYAARRVPRLTPVNYGVEDGLRSAQCAPSDPVAGGGFRTLDGQLWFPTSRGLAVLDPAAMKRPVSPLPLHILEVAAERPMDLSRPAEIGPSSGRMQIRYAAIFLSAPDRVQYSYKLEHADADWVSAGTRRVINYSNLPHGNYRFAVRAQVPDGTVTEQSYSFTILPHFYETAWFLLLALLLILAGIGAGYRLRLKGIQSRFAMVLDERARLSREIHDTLAQGFVGIGSQLDALALCVPDASDRARRHLNVARKMARHSLTEARRAVMDLRASALEGRSLGAALESGVRLLTDGSGVELDLDIKDPKVELSKETEQHVLRITQEAVANALKHGAADKISVHLHSCSDSGCLTLCVVDNGRGFLQDGAFSSANGHFGLVGMRERAKRIGAQLQLNTSPGKGTAVELTVPLR